MEHDYKNYPELTNAQIAEFGLMSPVPQITEDFVATVIKVHDGDTITLRTTFRDFDFPVRFVNIDAPEMNAGGEVAQQWLENQILNQEVQIGVQRKNRVGKYGRLLGRVYYRGLDMGESELRLGFAVPFGKKAEGEIPALGKELNLKKWLEI
ncbi:MAG: thermonuclease family protein [Proteobacteria bacterium]|nr:thermonuclease family protein [Pseudomonadota bacterium]